MTHFIPVFPLQIVVFPGEKLHLHIFEPRYRQLIQECHDRKIPFGIPSIKENTPTELGTLMELKEISKLYEDGKMDIKTEGLSVFRVLEYVKEIPEKLYSGAIVSQQLNFNNGSKSMMKRILDNIQTLHRELGIQKNFGKPDDELLSFDVAHHIGLSLDDEYQLLGYENELHRQEFIKRHLQHLLSVMKEMNALKEKVRLNGHFKDLSGFDFSTKE
jgi:hypothetical protein